MVGSSLILEIRLPGIMVTDTGGFRSSSHTTREDTLEKLNFEAMSRIVLGMYGSIQELTRKQFPPEKEINPLRFLR